MEAASLVQVEDAGWAVILHRHAVQLYGTFVVHTTPRIPWDRAYAFSVLNSREYERAPLW